MRVDPRGRGLEGRGAAPDVLGDEACRACTADPVEISRGSQEAQGARTSEAALLVTFRPVRLQRARLGAIRDEVLERGVAVPGREASRLAVPRRLPQRSKLPLVTRNAPVAGTHPRVGVVRPARRIELRADRRVAADRAVWARGSLTDVATEGARARRHAAGRTRNQPSRSDPAFRSTDSQGWHLHCIPLGSRHVASGRIVPVPPSGRRLRTTTAQGHGRLRAKRRQRVAGSHPVKRRSDTAVPQLVAGDAHRARRLHMPDPWRS